MPIQITYTRIDQASAGTPTLLAAKAGYRANLLALMGSFQGNVEFRSNTTVRFDMNGASIGAPTPVRMQQGLVPWVVSEVGEELDLNVGSSFEGVAICYYTEEDENLGGIEVVRTRINQSGSGSDDIIAAKAGYVGHLLGLYGSFQGTLTVKDDTTELFDVDAASVGAPSPINIQQSRVPWAKSTAGNALVIDGDTSINAYALAYYLPVEGDNDIVT